MKVVWEGTARTESLRLVNIASGMSCGFFKHNGFLVLPVGSKEASLSSRVVTFPDLNYNSVPRFWERVGRIDYKNLIGPKPPEISQDLLFDLPVPKYQKIDISKLWPAICSVIPKALDVKSIHVWPTNFGTTCSSSLCDGLKPFDIYVWLRVDQGESALVEAVVTSLTRPSQEFATWSESEATVDWIMSNSAIANALTNPADLTIADTRSKISANLQAQSDAFLAKIGAPKITLETIKSINTSEFSLKEKTLWQKFLEKPNQIVSFDDIGGEADDFSLYAITKTVQRLRDRMESQGVTGSLIQSKRGEGYILAS